MTLEDANQPMGDNWSISNTGNSPNETNIVCNLDVHRSTNTAPPPDNQPATSKQKEKILPPANKSICQSA